MSYIKTGFIVCISETPKQPESTEHENNLDFLHLAGSDSAAHNHEYQISELKPLEGAQNGAEPLRNRCEQLDVEEAVRVRWQQMLLTILELTKWRYPKRRDSFPCKSFLFPCLCWSRHSGSEPQSVAYLPAIWIWIRIAEGKRRRRRRGGGGGLYRRLAFLATIIVQYKTGDWTNTTLLTLDQRRSC